MQASAGSLGKDEQRLVQALGRAGVQVASVYDLVNTSASYPKAIPVLIMWLRQVSDDRVKEGIIRALAVKEARPVAARPLIEEFKALPYESGDIDAQQLLKWAIGNTLSVVADGSVYEEVAELLRDSRHGNARKMLPLALARTKHSKAADLLIRMLDDDQVAGHVIAALGRLRAPKARNRIEAFLNHPTAWVRREAKRALAKIEASQ